MLEIRAKTEEEMLKEAPKVKLHELSLYEPLLINGNDLIIN